MVGSGIVDQDVYTTASQSRGGHGICAAIGRKIADRDLGPSAGRMNRMGDCICPAHVTTVNDDGDAFCGKEFGNRLTQSGARSSYQCALSGKSQIHVRPFFLRSSGRRREAETAAKIFTSLQDRNLIAGEIGWPFRLGLQGRIVDRSQDLGWQRAFGHGREIVPEMLQRRGADDNAIIALGV